MKYDEKNSKLQSRNNDIDNSVCTCIATVRTQPEYEAEVNMYETASWVDHDIAVVSDEIKKNKWIDK